MTKKIIGQITVIDETDQNFKPVSVKVETIITDEEVHSIDKSEQIFLDNSYELYRRSISKFFENMSLQKAEEEQKINGGEIRVNPNQYRVDGEIGKFNFPSHSVYINSSQIYNTARDYFPPLVSRQRYQTAGFKEIAYEYCRTNSYRDSAKKLNHQQRQEENGTPSRTLQHSIEKEAVKIQTHLDEKADKILTENNFSQDASPTQDETFGISSKEACTSPESIAEAINEYNHDKEEDKRIDMRFAEENFEDKSKIINISVDKVEVKNQKEILKLRTTTIIVVVKIKR